MSLNDAWQFDHFAVMQTLSNIIEDIVGANLSELPNSGGAKSIIIANFSGNTPPLPYVTLNYQGSIDNDGITIDAGLIDVEIEDPSDPPNLITVTTQYEDKLTNFNITLRTESMPASTYDDKGNAHRLLREIRKGLMLDKHRKRLRDEVFTVLEFMNPIRSTPDLISTSYHDICTMQLKLSSVDRLIDYDALSFDTINWTGDVKLDDEDLNPLVLQGSATSIIP